MIMDMQDVFRQILSSIGKDYPRVVLINSARQTPRLTLPVAAYEGLDRVRVAKILEESVKGPVQVVVHDKEFWEFSYDAPGFGNVPLQFLKIFEIFYGLPERGKVKEVQVPVGNTDSLEQVLRELIVTLRERKPWWTRLWMWMRRVFNV